MDVIQTDKRPTITVVMAAYNAEAYITRAINSVQAQSFENWELICIDDGSTDNTQAIIRDFAGRDARIKLISQENSGPADARRKGYVAGEGDYFIMLDSDDWFAPDALETLLAEASRTGVDAVACHAMLCKPNDEGWESFHQLHGTPLGHQFSGHEAFSMTFPWKIHGICLWRRDVVKSAATDPKDAFNRFNADEYLSRKLFLACKNVLIGSGQYFIFPNMQSLTRSPSWRRFLSLETDRRLTDLAFDSGVSSEVVDKVISWQRRNLISHIGSFVRQGGDGKYLSIFKELWRSVIHYRTAALRIGRKWIICSLFFGILSAAVRASVGRLLSLVRRVYHKLRRQR